MGPGIPSFDILHVNTVIPKVEKIDFNGLTLDTDCFIVTRACVQSQYRAYTCVVTGVMGNITQRLHLSHKMVPCSQCVRL